jgi:RNA polymerase sigma-70 factor (ECF subfamily)
MNQVASTVSDAELVQQALDGRPDPFAALISRYERLVFAIVARATRNSAETDDLVQDVFLDAYRRLGSLRDPRKFRGWLAQLAANRACSWGRRQTVERAALPRLAREGGRRDEDRTSLDEQKGRLNAALAKLSPDAQAVVTLRYLEGLSAPEIADELGITPAAARQRLSRALRVLRRELGEEGRT